MCEPCKPPPCSPVYLPCGPWGPCCGGGTFLVKICTCQPSPCPPVAPLPCVLPPPPCPPPCVPCPPICGIYEQLIPKPRLPCPPPCPPKSLDFGHPPVPPCPQPCSQGIAPWPVCPPTC